LQKLRERFVFAGATTLYKIKKPGQKAGFFLFWTVELPILLLRGRIISKIGDNLMLG